MAGASLLAWEIEGEHAADNRAKTDKDWNNVKFFMIFGNHQNREKQRYSACLYQLYRLILYFYVCKVLNNIDKLNIYTN